MTVEIMIVLSLLVVLFFTGLKFVEMVYIDKDRRALKLFIRDAVYIFVATGAVLYLFSNYEKHIMDFFFFITNTKNVVPVAQTPIFTGEPGF